MAHATVGTYIYTRGSKDQHHALSLLCTHIWCNCTKNYPVATDVGQLPVFAVLYPSVWFTLCLGAWLAGMVFSNGFNADMMSADDGRALGSLQQIQEAAPLRLLGIVHSPDKNTMCNILRRQPSKLGILTSASILL